jgi:hypothetical protein
MKIGALPSWSRWLLVLPVSFFAGGAAAWIFSVIVGRSYADFIISGPTTFAHNLYAISAEIIYGWVLVSVGTATAPSRRPVVATALFCLLCAEIVVTDFFGALRPGVTPMSAALRVMGYVVGAAIAVQMVFVKHRIARAAESPR